MSKAPAFLKQYFWDIDFKKLDPQKSESYIIERILEVGDVKAIRWVFKTFDKEFIKSVIARSRALSPQTANYWGLMLDIDQKEIACLQKPYLAIRQTHWPY
ncbi:hypothetical protein HYU92_02385 [Candidatus Curtissbacteria bacterium]|nr:hypothetical protein [Candidatus Curtissbacteria bacterium]